MPISRLLVVSTQDSDKLSSWSNVPYLFCKTLEARGINLHRYTLKENTFIKLLILASQRIIGMFGGRNGVWSYSRSALFSWSAGRQIDHEIRKNNPEAVLILSFSYGPTQPSKLPIFLFGDWSLEYAIKCQQKRDPDKHEKASITRENQLIKNSSCTFVLFPLAERYIKGAQPKAKTYYLGNVINAVDTPCEEDIETKARSFSLLFIGKPHYLDGAMALINAYTELKASFNNITLDIVGMDSEKFKKLPNGVKCHGYLDKGNSKQQAEYYALVRKATLFVNTNRGWASFSAALEAMHFYTPIITSPNPEMEETFGKTISFGAYHQEGYGQPLSQLIAEFINDPDYKTKACNAHIAAMPYSWHAYVDRFLKVINQDAPATKALA